MHDYAAMAEGYCMHFKCKQMNNKGNYPTWKDTKITISTKHIK